MGWGEKGEENIGECGLVVWGEQSREERVWSGLWVELGEGKGAKLGEGVGKSRERGGMGVGRRVGRKGSGRGRGEVGEG